MLGRVCLALGRLGKKLGFWAKGHLGPNKGEGKLRLSEIRFFWCCWASGLVGHWASINGKVLGSGFKVWFESGFG